MKRLALTLNTLLLVFLLGLIASAMACSKQHRNTALNTTFASINVASAGWTEYDRRTQHEIIKSSTSLEDGRTKLAEYRKQRAKILERFVVVYQLLAGAALANDKGASGALQGAVRLLEQELAKIGVKQ